MRELYTTAAVTNRVDMFVRCPKLVVNFDALCLSELNSSLFKSDTMNIRFTSSPKEDSFNLDLTKITRRNILQSHVDQRRVWSLFKLRRDCLKPNLHAVGNHLLM